MFEIKRTYRTSTASPILSARPALHRKLFENGHCKRIDDPAVPLLERLLRKAKLITLRLATNPLALRREIHNLTDKIFKLPTADGRLQNVRVTILSSEAALAR